MQHAKVLAINKPVSYTPLQILNFLRSKYENYAPVKLAYAGRLDPMAEGVMVVLVGEECKKRDTYQKLPKQYEFQLVLGITTDSYDALGIITDTKLNQIPSDLYNQVLHHVSLLPGKHRQTLPPFSGGTYQGRKLFELAKHGNLNEGMLPSNMIEIYKSKVIKHNTLSTYKLQTYIMHNISNVAGDFRQKEILKQWSHFFTKHKSQQFYTVTIKVDCSSGTYIRSLVHQLGQTLGCGAFVLKIKRTKVGRFMIKDCIDVV